MDDLSCKYVEIVKVNNHLLKLENEGSLGHVTSEFSELLQYHIGTLIQNKGAGIVQSKLRSGRPIKSLGERLGGKFGRLRGSLMGKRCDFSARTVVGGSPDLSLNEVGVPELIGKTITIGELVTLHNREKLQELVRRGPFVHP